MQSDESWRSQSIDDAGLQLDTDPARELTAVQVLGRCVRYGLAFALLWVLLTQGSVDSWLIGIVVVPLATWCAIYLFAVEDKHKTSVHQSLRPGALLRFIPFFIAESLKGGWQSALLAIHPQGHLRPGFIQYVTHLPAGRPQLFFINIISLLPGTVSVAWQDNTIIIHVLDIHADNDSELRRCETQIAGFFGLDFIDLVTVATKAVTGERQ